MKNPPLVLKIAPSILSADFGKLNDEIATVDSFVDLIHVDIMDGHFVPNITFGPDVVEKIKSRAPLDCHLMIEHPEKYIETFVKALKISQRKKGIKKCYITVHAETCRNLSAILRQIKKHGAQAAVALNPDTPLSKITPVLSQVDMVLCMTVFPGFGGQKFISSVLSKIQKLRRIKPKLNIQVDGGINEKTAQEAIKAGANVLVAGSYIFGATDREKAIRSLQSDIHFADPEEPARLP